MNIIDISWPISPAMTQYKNNQYVECHPRERAGSTVAEHLWHLHTHTGTHIDAPQHMLPEGKTLEQLPLDLFIGPARVIELTHVEEKITAQDLERHFLQPHERIILKTQNSFLLSTAPFCATFIFIDATAATFLASLPIKTVGFDYLGIERSQPAHPTHKILLHAGIGIIEGLRLEHVVAGTYELYCLPLALVGMDGAPARAVLKQL